MSDDEYVKCHFTKNGCMANYTFHCIMVDIFILYIKRKREALGLPETEPVTVDVNGHNSRYNYQMLNVQAENNIHLLVIPAHSSHRMQPLDLKLNKLVEDN